MTAGALTGALSGSAPAAVKIRPFSMPWDLNDLLRLLTVNAVMVLALVVASFGVSGTAVLTEAATYTVVGIAGVVLQGCGNMVWLMRGRRAIGERQTRLLAELELLVGAEAEPEATTTTGTLAPGGDAELVTVAGTTRYHRSDCQLVAGKDVVATSRPEHVAEGRSGCGVCEP